MGEGRFRYNPCHNEARDLTGDLLSTVCKDVELEPTLQPLTGEHFKKISVNTEVGARHDVSAKGFWTRGNKAFVDVRIFNPISKTSMSKPLKSVLSLMKTRRKESIMKGYFK